jgi:hypothetical protein
VLASGGRVRGAQAYRDLARGLVEGTATQSQPEPIGARA